MMMTEAAIQPQRRLAAILAADVAGYSRLVELDEETTLAALQSSMSMIGEQVTAHQGRVFGGAGDSVVAEFASAVSAVRCADAIQREMSDRNATIAEDRRMRFRIGINLGDVVVEDGDLLGDGVNVAARLEGLANPGGICISHAIYEQVRGKVDHSFQDLGERELRNISQKVRVFRLAAAGEAPVALAAPPPDPTASRPTIAVLPFDVFGGDAEQSYFADGITEDLITELSRFQELLVTARNSVFAYKGTPKNITDVGRELGVRFVLEGSVRKAGNRVRVTAQLIDAATGHHLWAERFDREIEDVFAVQDEVTRRIVATLAGKLSDSERRRIRGTERTGNLAAYDLVLRGREYWFHFTKDCNAEARRLYQKAIKLDPDYARAYGSLAWTYLMDYQHGWSEDRDSDYHRALEAARQGIQVNPASHSNHLTLGQIYLWTGQHGRAILALKRGIELNPNDADGYMFLGMAQAYRGEPEALETIETGLGLASAIPDWHYWHHAMALALNGRYDAAVTEIGRMKDPSKGALRWLIVSLSHTGRTEEARKAAQELLRREPEFRIGEQIRTMPFARDTDRDAYTEGLRLAGLPE